VLIPPNEIDMSGVPARGLTEKTCRKWGYGYAEFKGKSCQPATYYRDGMPVAQKIRFKDKGFTFIGDTTSPELFGQHLWPSKGKRIIVTEGEVDAMSYSQISGHTWPVVSVPNGAGGAAKSIKDNCQFLEGYDLVVFMFDMDEPGQRAAKDCVAAMSAGKGAIARLPMKDVNECLVARRSSEVLKAMYDAKVVMPGGLITGSDIREALEDIYTGRPKRVVPWPWEGMNLRCRKGLWTREVVLLGAGTGVGKSTFIREIVTNLIDKGEKVLLISLEEDLDEAVEGLVAMRQKTPMDDLLPTEIQSIMKDSEEDLKYIEEHIVLHVNDNGGTSETDALLSRIRYAIKALDCTYVVLDHITMLVSGRPGTNERLDIDYAITSLKHLAGESGCGMLVVSHLSRNDKKNKSHEEGASVGLRDFRGSHSLPQLAHLALALQRDTLSDEPEATEVVMLKRRRGGQTGKVCSLEYNQETGRLTEATSFSEGL